MVPHRVAPRVAKLFLVVIPLCGLVACPKPGPTISKKDPAEITLPPKGSLLAFEQIEKALAKFDWGPAHDAPCQGCGAAGDVTIRYTGKTKDITPGNGPAKLRIVAIIQNYSTQDVLHTPSKTTFRAKTKYLMWVHSKNSTATWGFIELGPGYESNPKEIGQLVSCGHKERPSPTDDADFKTCEDPYNASSSRGFIATAYAAPQGGSSQTVRVTPSISKPGWIGCDPDCCTGTTTQVVDVKPNQ